MNTKRRHPQLKKSQKVTNQLKFRSKSHIFTIFYHKIKKKYYLYLVKIKQYQTTTIFYTNII